MIRRDDVQWWALEVRKHPEAAPQIVEELSRRLLELDEQNERLRSEIIHLKRRAPTTKNDAEKVALRHKVSVLQDMIRGQATAETALVFLSERQQATRLDMVRVEELAREKRRALGGQALIELCQVLAADDSDELLALTSRGTVVRWSVADIPSAEAGIVPWPDSGSGALDPGERVTAAVCVRKPPRFWVTVTRRGFVQRFVRVVLDRNAAEGERLSLRSPFPNDEPAAIVDGDGKDLLLLTRWGRSVRFPNRSIDTHGSIGLELDPDDEIAAALPVGSATQILAVTASGYAARYNVDQVRLRLRPGGTGKPLIRARDVMSVFPYPRPRVIFVTCTGKIVSLAELNIPIQQHAGPGTLLHDLRDDPALAIVPLPG